MQTKEDLLADIEKLLTYTPEEKTTINPNYLDYLEVSDLLAIKKSLMEKVGQLNAEDIEWLKQFKEQE